MSVTPQQLLDESVPESDGRKRYAACDGRPFCAQSNGPPNVRHGYPVNWEEVPSDIRREWLAEGRITKKNLRDHW